jgi:hypothetical protein
MTHRAAISQACRNPVENESQCSRRNLLAATMAAATTLCGWPDRSAQARMFATADESAVVPRTAAELWALFDPRHDPLQTELIREWQADGVILRHVRFLVGHFRGTAARLTAIYGFPERQPSRKLPGVLHIHGGGQRGSLSEVRFLAARGYAGLSISWGGSSTGQPPTNPLEGAEPGDPATDWGRLDPTQLNVAGYASVLPGPQQWLTDREDPRNNNWYILTLGCQRALTFLEQQPEVDPERLGVHGYSMGGNLTMYTAAADRRVRVAVPGVGGAGWRWQLHEFAGDRGRPQDHVTGDLELFRSTLSFESVAPLIRCPLLHRSATNDFHGWMDDVYRTNLLIPDQPLRYSWTIHMNHRLAEETAVALPLWLDQHLQGGPALPETPAVRLLLDPGQAPGLQVNLPEHDWAVDRCDVYYSVDGDPRARFWRSTDVAAQRGQPKPAAEQGQAGSTGQCFQASLPLESLERPLFAFANVFYRLPQPVDMSELPGFREPVQRLCLSSVLLSATSQQLQAAGVQATLQRGSLIDDFSRGLRDWYQLNAGHISLVQTWTRKLTDPLYHGAVGARLRISLQMERTNRLTFVIVQNEWRNYRGPRLTWVCEREIPGGDDVQQLELAAEDFGAADGSGVRLADWTGLDQFGVCAHFSERRERTEVRPWDGAPASLKCLEWV